jgi:hypothetical protein
VQTYKRFVLSTGRKKGSNRTVEYLQRPCVEYSRCCARSVWHTQSVFHHQHSAVACNMQFPVYQIDFSAVAAGKRVAATKRRIRWCVCAGFVHRDSVFSRDRPVLGLPN